MHDAEHHEHESDFRAEKFDRGLQVVRFVAVLERQRDISDVDQIKSDDQQMIDGISPRFIAMKCIDQKNPPTAMQSFGDPNREHNAHSQIRGVAVYGGVHKKLLSKINLDSYICYFCINRNT